MEKKTEIELKAHVDNHLACKNQLDKLAGVGIAFSKDDAYWFLKTVAALPKSGLRIRREKAGNGERTLVTYKTKERREGIEINDEHEFEVSDGDCFEELLVRLGLEKRTYKHKQGWSWNYSGITAELAEVSGAANPAIPAKNLDWFLELEILAEDGADETVTAARQRLLELLEKAGIGEDYIESRYYSELLAE
jgi:adenylate cyclase class 2